MKSSCKWSCASSSNTKFIESTSFKQIMRGVESLVLHPLFRLMMTMMMIWRLAPSRLTSLLKHQWRPGRCWWPTGRDWRLWWRIRIWEIRLLCISKRMYWCGYSGILWYLPGAKVRRTICSRRVIWVSDHRGSPSVSVQKILEPGESDDHRSQQLHLLQRPSERLFCLKNNERHDLQTSRHQTDSQMVPAPRILRNLPFPQLRKKLPVTRTHSNQFQSTTEVHLSVQNTHWKLEGFPGGQEDHWSERN